MKPYSTDFREKILDTKQKTGESIQETAELSSVSYSFVQKLLKRYEEEGTTEPKSHGGGAQAKLKPEDLPELEKLLSLDNDATLQQLSDRLAEKTGVKVSVPTMCRLLQKLKLTRKKKTLHATEAETLRVQNLRVQYWTIIAGVPLKDLVFIDETGVNLAMTPRYARAYRGHRAYSKCPFNRGNNVTMIGAMALSGLLASFTFEG